MSISNFFNRDISRKEAKEQEKVTKGIKICLESYEAGINTGIQMMLHILELKRTKDLQKDFLEKLINDSFQDLKKNTCSFNKGYFKVLREQLMCKKADLVKFGAEKSLADLEREKQNSIPFSCNPSQNQHGIMVEELNYNDIYLRHD